MKLPFSTTSSYYHHHHHHHNNININYYFKSFLTFFQPSSSYSSSTCHNNNIITSNNNNNNNNNIITHMEPPSTPSTKPDPPPISTTTTVRRHRKRKIIIIMGPTGAGKSRLSVDLITKYFPTGEIINSDKMPPKLLGRHCSGLNITTNKITPEDQLRVPHHLLGAIDPTKPVFTASEFRKLASEYVNEIKSRRGLPFVVGGSNSLIYSLVTKRYDSNLDVFNGPDPSPVSLELRYDCCFIWVDVCLPVLNQYLHKRVDEMLDSGMFEELVEYFGSGQNTRVNKSGLGQAIGVPEFETYFEKFGESEVGFGESEVVGGGREVLYEEVVRRIKDNTCQLAKKQVSKILRLRDAGWDLKRVDATEAFRAAMMMTSDSGGGTRVAEVWEKHVVEPSMNIVKQFLDE